MDYLTPSGQTVPSGRRPQAYLWFLLVPLLTGGLASFLLPLWAIAQVRSAAGRRDPAGLGRAPAEGASPQLPAPVERLLGLAAAMAVGALAALVLLAAAPTDAEGSPTGALATLATLLLLALAAVGAGCALAWRSRLFPVSVSPQIAMLNAARVPEPVAQARARREVREQYRRVAASDPVLARELGVGRPRSEGLVDDGGLLDLNGLSAEELAAETRMPLDVARAVVALRERQGALSSVDEIVVFVALPKPAEDQLREYAVFL